MRLTHMYFVVVKVTATEFSRIALMGKSVYYPRLEN
jgi:hypothetical protein